MAGPTMPPFRGCRGVAVAAALAVVLYGCDQATGPTPTAPTGSPRLTEGAAFTVVQAGKPVLHDAAVRYRNAGRQPGRGRAGTAELSMLALVGRDGNTEVRLSTGDVSNPWAAAPGSIARVQAKGFAPDGTLLFTDAQDGTGGATASFTYARLGRGSTVQAQANVVGVDGTRTDVVAVADAVWRRPNLRVAGVTAPERTGRGDPTVIFAAIQESNRDVGNWAVCALYVNGARVDWADRVWVDAGDQVACAFTHRFEHEGEHAVEVRVDAAPGAPHDDDPRDNAATARIRVFTPQQLSVGVWAFDIARNDSSVQTTRWEDPGWAYESRSFTVNRMSSQNIFVNGYTPQLLQSRQVRVDVVESSGGQTVIDRSYMITMDEADGGSCGYFMAERPAAHIYICSTTWNGGTSLFYDRNAYRITYHSRQFMTVWDQLSGERTVYEQSYAEESGPGATPFLGNDFAMRVRLYDGAEVFAADAAMTLDRQEYDLSMPEQCNESAGYRTCTTTWGTMVLRMGSYQSQ